MGSEELAAAIPAFAAMADALRDVFLWRKFAPVYVHLVGAPLVQHVRSGRWNPPLTAGHITSVLCTLATLRVYVP